MIQVFQTGYQAMSNHAWGQRRRVAIPDPPLIVTDQGCFWCLSGAYSNRAPNGIKRRLTYLESC